VEQTCNINEQTAPFNNLVAFFICLLEAAQIRLLWLFSCVIITARVVKLRKRWKHLCSRLIQDHTIYRGIRSQT
ncbi:hypothetical protein CHUAL_010076, partial [Chamberlinius hualienensis]